MLKKELMEKISKLEHESDKVIQSVREMYGNQITELKKQCDHINDDGTTALVIIGYPWHSGWDRCTICDKSIETNEYGRD